jgi:hypothetical protein
MSRLFGRRFVFPVPSSAFNKYADVNRAADPHMDWKGCCYMDTRAKIKSFIIRADVATEIDVEVLAQAFNMDKASLLAPYGRSG